LPGSSSLLLKELFHLQPARAFLAPFAFLKFFTAFLFAAHHFFGPGNRRRERLYFEGDNLQIHDANIKVI